MRSKSETLLLVLIISLFNFGSVDAAFAQAEGPTDSARAPTPSTGSLPGPPIKWTAKLPSLGYQTQAGNVVPAIIIRNGIIYVPGGNTLTAFDVQTGRELWTFNPGSGLSLTQLEVADKTVILAFAFTGDLVPPGGVPQAYMIAVDTRTGRERWSYDTHESWISASAVVADSVYLAGSSGSIYRLKAATGELKWSMPSPLGDYVADITGSGGILYLLGSRLDPGQKQVYSIYAVDAESKQMRWSLEAPGIDDIGIGFPSIRLTDTIIYITGVHSLYALEEATGKVRWKYTLGSQEQGEFQKYPAIRTTPIVVDDMVYLGVALRSGTQVDCYGTLESYVLGLDTETGQERWRFKTEDDIDIGESLAVDGGTLYYTSSAVCGFTYTLSSYLYAVEMSSHSIIWRQYAGSESYFVPPLVVTQGTLFTGSVRTSPDAAYDLFYAVSTASVEMPKTGASGVSLWLLGLVGIFNIVFGVVSIRIDRLNARKHARN